MENKLYLSETNNNNFSYFEEDNIDFFSDYDKNLNEIHNPVKDIEESIILSAENHNFSQESFEKNGSNFIKESNPYSNEVHIIVDEDEVKIGSYSAEKEKGDIINEENPNEYNLENNNINYVKDDDNLSVSGQEQELNPIDINNATKEVFKELLREDNNSIKDEENKSGIYFIQRQTFLTFIQNKPKNDINITKKEEKIIKKEKKEKKEERCNKNFPFNKGIGLEETLKKIGLIYDKDKKIIKNMIFRTTEITIVSNGKSKKVKKRRKYKPDNIRKKIKSRFHKDFKIRLNKILKNFRPKIQFDLFPQKFITNVNININQQVMNITFEKLIENDCLEDIDKNENKAGKNKLKKNKETLNYLKTHPDFCKKTGFDKIIIMTYEQILKAYFTSKEYEKSLIDLYYKNKDEKIDYFEEYIFLGNNYIEFYKKGKDKIIKKKEGVNDDKND